MAYGDYKGRIMVGHAMSIAKRDPRKCRICGELFVPVTANNIAVCQRQACKRENGRRNQAKALARIKERKNRP